MAAILSGQKELHRGERRGFSASFDLNCSHCKMGLFTETVDNPVKKKGNWCSGAHEYRRSVKMINLWSVVCDVNNAFQPNARGPDRVISHR